MSKGMYAGVSSIARKGKKAYFGVNGVARKVKKIYVGVNNVARLAFNSDALEGSNIMLRSYSKKIHVNNNKDFSIAKDKWTLYADTSNISGNGAISGKISPKGNYIWSGGTIYKLEEGKVAIYETLTYAKFPSSVVGNYLLDYFGGCFSYDEQYFYVASHNTDTSSSPYVRRYYVSSFKITDSGLQHISTIYLDGHASLYYGMRGINVAVAENARVLAVNAYYYKGDSGSNTEYRRVFRIELNADYSLGTVASIGEKVNAGGEYYTSSMGEQGLATISANGLWVVTLHYRSVTQGFAYLYHLSYGRLVEKDPVQFLSDFGGFKMTRNRLLVCDTLNGEGNARIVYYLLNDDGTVTANSINFPTTLLGFGSIDLLNATSGVSRDGTALVVCNSRTRLWVCKLNYTANTIAVVESVELDSSFESDFNTNTSRSIDIINN